MLVSQKMMDEVSAKGQLIYEERLKPLLEPDHNNEYVVIHVDSGDYALGRTFTKALRAIRQRHEADGRLIGMKIGPEPEYGLAARILASQIAGKSEK